MNSKKNIKHYRLVIVLLIVMEIFFVFLSVKSFNNKNLDKYIMGENNKTNKMLAIMLEDENGDYKAYNSETFPEFPYMFNSELSQCMDIKGNVIEDAISYDEDNNLANVVVTKTSQCYFYFNRPREAGVSLTNKLIGSGELWQSGLEGDGYRYVGSGSYDSETTPSNFICFGTTGKTECKNNETKYLYRIIGVFEGNDGKQHLKLISFKQLGRYAWNSSNSQVNWDNTTLFSKLNGEYFLTNTAYDYMQNSTWLNKIEDWTWSAVKAPGTSSSTSYYNLTSRNIYLHEMNRDSKSTTSGSWTFPTGKISLMYVSDYTLSLGSSSLSLKGYSTNLQNGWVHINNNIDSNDSSTENSEWTMSNSGQNGSSYYAWYVYKTSAVNDTIAIHNSLIVRPTFYLSSDIAYNSGTGTYIEPFIISESPSSNLYISVQLNEDEVTGTITQGDYDLNKYCINTSSNSYENCTWKKIDSLTITDTLPDYETYYIHIIDKGGYVVHSVGIKKPRPMVNKLINSGELWQSGLEGDGYRYVGSGNYDSETTPNNFICFGTSDKTKCKNNESKYMYRILGVFEGSDSNHHLKLISFKQLGTYAWNSKYTRNVGWESSDMYTGLNGSYFLTNTTYDYMQNATWLNKIEDWTWSAVNTKANSSGGPDYSAITTQEMYLHEMNRNTKSNTTGEWSTPVAKIGLMYASDYQMSLGSSSLSYTGNSDESTLNTGWMYQSNNDTTVSSTEWTMQRDGFNGKTNSALRVVYGSVASGTVNKTSGVRPVFYLTSDVTHNSGTGTYSDPYIINE